MAEGSGGYWTWSFRGFDQKVLRQYRSPATNPFAPWLWVEDYVYAGGRLLAAERPAEEGRRRHFHLDHLGTPRLVTGDFGRLISQHDYTAYGIEYQPDSGTASNQEVAAGFDREEPMRFTGHERGFTGGTAGDNAASLDYLHARYYVASMGRFMSVDPASGRQSDPQAWNRYGYARSNPLKYIDPNGKDIAIVGPNFSDVFTFLARTAQHPQGRADLTAIARNSGFVANYHDDHINSPQQIAYIRAHGGLTVFAVATPDHTSGATRADVAVDTSAVQALHPTDHSGVTTIAHEDNHVVNMMNNVPYAQIAATDTNGSAEAYGRAVAASPTDMTQQQAEAYVTKLLFPPDPPSTLTDVQPDLLPPEE